MAKVFRIHNQGALNVDWFPSTPINESLIESISTDGGDGKKLPTSIPSPFARMDLVRTAFKIVGNKTSNLDGIERNGKAMGSDNHKLISDALDIGQIFFNYNKHKDDLSLVAWDKDSSLNTLLKGNKKQQHLGNTLKLFLNQDSKQYNFDKFDKIYILKYKHKIIGGTSPRTLFFAAPSVEPTDIKFGNDVMLDDALLPLYKRDEEYIKFLYVISLTPNFNDNFPEFNSYLKKSLEKINQTKPEFYHKLMSLNGQDYLDSLENVLFNGNTGQPLEVIRGLILKQYVVDPSRIQKTSDFVINTTKEIQGFKPLVLPVEPYNLKYTYTFDVWNPETVVPVYDNRPIEKRTLPEQEDPYPYLTMNDFLTDSIIKLPYQVNKDKFFTLGENQYLLPLTSKFFNYFNVKDVLEGNFIKFTKRAGDSIEVILTIPIKNSNTIQYSKLYMANGSTDPKKGRILTKSFALSVFPFISSENIDIEYTLGLADIKPENDNSLELNVVNTSQSNTSLDLITKLRSESPFITTQSKIKDRFDIIKIRYGNCENFIIPTWKEYVSNGGDVYHFAIDFGTTNSHIEYKIDGQGSERAFDISKNDEQIVFLMSENVSERDLDVFDVRDAEHHLQQEVIPKNFGADFLVNSPFRSCLVQNKNTNYTLPTAVFTDANAGFDYEKHPIRPYLKSFTNLKWANKDNDDNKRLSLYIEELLTLCKSKVLINNGSLKDTEIRWFFPVSMTSNHLGRLKKIWTDKFKIVFGDVVPESNLLEFPESLTPFYFYKEKGNIRVQAKPSVSIDIGGGTTDIMIYADGEPQLISSFRFAGNAIFGDAFNGNIKNNGFIRKYYPKIKDILSQNKLTTQIKILEKLYNDNESSQDVVNFFFSLKENNEIKKKHLDNLDFSDNLSGDGDFKIIFLLFYSAIVYHIAQMMKVKGLDSPRNIVFSGTGSKTLSILENGSEKFPVLSKVFECIYDRIYEESNSKIDVKLSEKPKEVTSKGGFYVPAEISDKNHTNLVEVNTGNYKNLVVQSLNEVSNRTIKYKDLNNEFFNGVVENVKNFYDVFEELMQNLNFRDNFGVSAKSAKLYNEIKSEDLLDYVMQGNETFTKDAEQEDNLRETFFFFPLIGKINELASEISNT